MVDEINRMDRKVRKRQGRRPRRRRNRRYDNFSAKLGLLPEEQRTFARHKMITKEWHRLKRIVERMEREDAEAEAEAETGTVATTDDPVTDAATVHRAARLEEMRQTDYGTMSYNHDSVPALRNHLDEVGFGAMVDPF